MPTGVQFRNPSLEKPAGSEGKGGKFSLSYESDAPVTGKSVREDEHTARVSEDGRQENNEEDQLMVALFIIYGSRSCNYVLMCSNSSFFVRPKATEDFLDKTGQVCGLTLS